MAASAPASFAEAFAAENERFSKQSYADALNAAGPFPIFGLRDCRGAKTRCDGQLYQTKQKKVLVVVFVGILSRDPVPMFGRVVMFSSGGPGSTVKIETPRDEPTVMQPVAEVAEGDASVADARQYYKAFLENVMMELGFNNGLFIPELNGEYILLCAKDADSASEASSPPPASAAAAAAAAPRGNEVEEEEEEEEGHKPGKRSNTDDAVQEQQERPGEAKRARTEEKEGGDGFPEECMICMDAPPQTLVLPCLHRVVCEACSAALRGTNDRKTCTYCRSEITGVSYESGQTEFV
jgi:hypothetical protein